MLGGVPFANRVHPFVFGLPFLLAWIVLWVVVTSLVMALIFALDTAADSAAEKSRGSDDASVARHADRTALP